jgi:hypothetical protein
MRRRLLDEEGFSFEPEPKNRSNHATCGYPNPEIQLTSVPLFRNCE